MTAIRTVRAVTALIAAAVLALAACSSGSASPVDVSGTAWEGTTTANTEVRITFHPDGTATTESREPGDADYTDDGAPFTWSQDGATLTLVAPGDTPDFVGTLLNTDQDGWDSVVLTNGTLDILLTVLAD